MSMLDVTYLTIRPGEDASRHPCRDAHPAVKAKNYRTALLRFEPVVGALLQIVEHATAVDVVSTYEGRPYGWHFSHQVYRDRKETT